MDFILPNLAVGSDHIDLARCKRNGITHVVNASFSHDPEDMIRAVDYLYNPTNDDGDEKGAGYWMRTVIWAERALQDPEAKIYAHCAAGINRGPAHAYAILRGVFGYESDEAKKLIKQARPKAGRSLSAMFAWGLDVTSGFLDYTVEIDRILGGRQ